MHGIEIRVSLAYHGSMSQTFVISLGGSIVAPDKPDTAFLREFSRTIREHIEANESRFILVVGGGGPARAYQTAYRELVEQPEKNEQDWIGIAATRLNAQLVRGLFHDLAPQPVVVDPSAVESFQGSVLIAAGWKPGFSTDFDAVILAERFSGDTIINLSNIEKVYTADPKKDPKAEPLDRVSWEEFRRIVGEEWNPGSNFPFDPVATKRAATLGLRVIAAAGRDLQNLKRILREERFEGSQIGPE